MDKTGFMNKVEWVTKRKNTYSGEADVSICHNPNAQKPFTHIVIRANLHELITTTNHIKFGIYKNRMIFAEATQKEGYKLTDKNKSDNVYVKLPIWEGCPFDGDYALKYDDLYEYYYIELAE